MIRRYLDAALSRARYTQLEDGSYGGEVRDIPAHGTAKIRILKAG